MRISKSTKTSVKASGASNNRPLTKAEVKELWDTQALFIDVGDSDAMCQDNGYTLEQILRYMDAGNKVYIDACDGVSTSKKISADKGLSSNEQALKHITAAIDILGKSSKKDDVTKDIIANLAVVAMDIKASKK